jgi:hypothetical protein
MRTRLIFLARDALFSRSKKDEEKKRFSKIETWLEEIKRRLKAS